MAKMECYSVAKMECYSVAKLGVRVTTLGFRVKWAWI